MRRARPASHHGGTRRAAAPAARRGIADDGRARQPGGPGGRRRRRRYGRAAHARPRRRGRDARAPDPAGDHRRGERGAHHRRRDAGMVDPGGGRLRGRRGWRPGCARSRRPGSCYAFPEPAVKTLAGMVRARRAPARGPGPSGASVDAAAARAWLAASGAAPARRLGLPELARCSPGTASRAPTAAPSRGPDDATPAGKELLLGGVRDAQWGPVLTVGLGGVYVEVVGDTAVALAPVSPAEATVLLDGTPDRAPLTAPRWPASSAGSRTCWWISRAGRDRDQSSMTSPTARSRWTRAPASAPRSVRWHPAITGSSWEWTARRTRGGRSRSWRGVAAPRRAGDACG
jgi:hypothetical protein